MKRKLISFDAFKKIEEASLTNAQKELIGAEEVLAKTLGVDNLKLYTFGENDVTYEAPDGSFVHATYDLNKEKLVLENIEQLVIEEEGEKKYSRQILSDMIDSLLENKQEKATHLFENYLSTPIVRRNLNEAVMPKKGKTGKHLSKEQKDKISLAKKGKKLRQSTKGKMKAARVKNKLEKDLLKDPMKKNKCMKMIKEMARLYENVKGYVDYKKFGPIMNESHVRIDDRGNLNAVSIPTEHKRNESKILSFNWKTLDTDCKVLRGKMKKLTEDQNFVKAMVDLKRYNNISDNNSLEETLEAIVSRWPNVLYVTESELSDQISTALEYANVKNYDDATCAFMAEAILRSAHNAYTDRVRKIASLAGVSHDVTAECKKCEDAYKEFAEIAEEFFTKLDENTKSETQVFTDLYNSLGQLRQLTVETGDDEIRSDIEDYMRECAYILNGDAEIDVDLAEEISSYIADFVESNLQGAQDWEVSSVHHTINGDHPRTSWNASMTDAVPSKFTGDWGDSAPVSDGKSYKNNLADEMRSSSYGNHADSDTYPDLSNPYVPKAGEYKMKEKSAINDGDGDWSKWQSNDTWPNLKNPYIPDNMAMDPSKYKANSDDLVADTAKRKM